MQSLFHIGCFRRVVCSDVVHALLQKAESHRQETREPFLHELHGVFRDLASSSKAVCADVLLRELKVCLAVARSARRSKDCGCSCNTDCGCDCGLDTSSGKNEIDLGEFLVTHVEKWLVGTSLEGTVRECFEGQYEVSALGSHSSVDRPCWTEPFYDLRLDLPDEDTSVTPPNLVDTLVTELILHGKPCVKSGKTYKVHLKVLPVVLNLILMRPSSSRHSRFEFPRKLDLRRWLPGSAVYSLHTVIDRSCEPSGFESGGHRVHVKPDSDGNGGQWLRFSEMQVMNCNDYAAVDNTFGGEDLNVWNYLESIHSEIKDGAPLTRHRTRNACFLTYVRDEYP